MSNKVNELKLDLEELKGMLSAATRPNVQDFIAGHISQVKTELQLMEAQEPKKQKVEVVHHHTHHNYQPLIKYMWNDEGKKVKIYFELPNVGNECPANQTQFTFKPESVQFKLHGYHGQDHIFAIKRLFAEINANDSSYLIKTNTIVLTLIKKQNKTWSQLAYKQDKFKVDDTEQKKEGDPGDSLMKMMKKMYDEGDSNMKKTIAEAWTKANDKKKQGKSGLNDFD